MNVELYLRIWIRASDDQPMQKPNNELISFISRTIIICTRCVCVFVCVCVCVCVCMYVHVYVCVYTCVHAHVGECVCVHMLYRRSGNFCVTFFFHIRNVHASNFPT